MSEMDFSMIAGAIECRSGFDGNAPAQRSTDLPRWLVDHEFDTAMVAMGIDGEPTDEVLPRRLRLGILLALAVLAWLPIVVAGAMLWN